MNVAPQSYFDTLYSQHPDPWRVADRWYEVRKRNLLLAALPRARFSHAYEPGCGTGELTVQLAQRCDRVLAADFSDAAIGVARQKLQHAPHVDIQRHTMPQDWPWPVAADAGDKQRFDLIVISEFAYYLSDQALEAMATLAAATLAKDGCLIACHWRHDFEERMNTTDAVHAAFDHQAGLCRAGGYRDSDFLLDIWSAEGCHSVASREGLV